MASNVVSDNFETGSGGVPQLGGTGATTCKAWVYFSMAAASINDSYNVSSITDLGVGSFRVNLTNALANTNYAVFMSSQNNSTNTNTANNIRQGGSTTTTTFMLQHVENGSPYDAYHVTAQVFGD